MVMSLGLRELRLGVLRLGPGLRQHIIDVLALPGVLLAHPKKFWVLHVPPIIHTARVDDARPGHRIGRLAPLLVPIGGRRPVLVH